MPFDMMPQTDADILWIARDLIDAPEKITCGTFKTNAGHCTYAAIMAATGEVSMFGAKAEQLGRLFIDANGINRKESTVAEKIAYWHDSLASRVDGDMTQLCPLLTAAFDRTIALAESAPR